MWHLSLHTHAGSNTDRKSYHAGGKTDQQFNLELESKADVSRFLFSIKTGGRLNARKP